MVSVRTDPRVERHAEGVGYVPETGCVSRHGPGSRLHLLFLGRLRSTCNGEVVLLSLTDTDSASPRSSAVCLIPPIYQLLSHKASSVGLVEPRRGHALAAW